MSKQTESNLFMVSSIEQAAGFYQHLLKGIATHEQLAIRILTQIEAAYSFRQVERVRELARVLANVPIREYRLIAQYYLVWCKCQKLQFHPGILERIAEETHTYKAKALISRAAFEVYQGNGEEAFYFYVEAQKAEPTPSDFIKASTGIATLKSTEGFHASALKDLERLLPLLRYAEPLTYFEVINSCAVELIANGRFSEAGNASLVSVSSPFGPFYPEWQETFLDARAKRKRRSTIAISVPQQTADEIEYSELPSNVLQFPTGERILEVQAALESREVREPSLTPLQLLGLILRMMLDERVTDDEIEKICVLYYDTVTKWYPADWTSGI